MVPLGIGTAQEVDAAVVADVAGELVVTWFAPVFLDGPAHVGVEVADDVFGVGADPGPNPLDRVRIVDVYGAVGNSRLTAFPLGGVDVKREVDVYVHVGAFRRGVYLQHNPYCTYTQVGVTQQAIAALRYLLAVTA